MNSVRCGICRQQLPTLKILISHYLTAHSKLQIIKEFLRISVLKSTPNLLRHSCKNKTKKSLKRARKAVNKEVKTETLYLNGDIHILCSQNDIIIGDSKGVDAEFSFDENSTENSCYYAPLTDNNGNIIPKKKMKPNGNLKFKESKEWRSPSTSSEDGNHNLEVIRRRIKRKKRIIREEKALSDKYNEAKRPTVFGRK
ncbi:hypothetical protein NQ317_006945 [Molorchus minor]|uniref:C2H2-type domain-containing protein n=1 Tax=Molorchus minor TaxID=1323400 RepID=A0ABQ9JN65_9CUCU|nr:hypothetical protein NQ317_006945 [Molorchus minor]